MAHSLKSSSFLFRVSPRASEITCQLTKTIISSLDSGCARVTEECIWPRPYGPTVYVVYVTNLCTDAQHFQSGLHIKWKLSLFPIEWYLKCVFLFMAVLSTNRSRPCSLVSAIHRWVKKCIKPKSSLVHVCICRSMMFRVSHQRPIRLENQMVLLAAFIFPPVLGGGEWTFLYNVHLSGAAHVTIEPTEIAPFSRTFCPGRQWTVNIAFKRFFRAFWPFHC